MSLFVRGIPETLAALERIQLEAEAAKPVASMSGAEVVASVMRAQAPRRTGRLASSIRVQRDGDDAVVGAEVAYDRFVQKGTRYMAPQPYGEEAADETHDAIAAAMAAVFKAVLR